MVVFKYGRFREMLGTQNAMTKSEFFDRRVIGPVRDLLTQGITPEKIGLSLAFGIMLGVFPVLGSTTILCIGAALIFRLNLPAIQLVNWLIYPLQLIFFVPFIRLGESLFRAGRLPISVGQILTMSHEGLRHMIAALWLVEVHAISAWMIVAPPAILLIHLLLSRVLRRVLVSPAANERT